jgi:5-formyltetrahydrofolate cyclo-ligase
MRDLANRQMGMAWSVVDERHAQDWRPCPGMKALLEPHELLPEVDPATFDGVWVPGVAFSERGERIGAGGGFYDTFLGQFPALFRVAVAAEFQVFSSLPDQRPDEPRMSVIVSESSVRFFDTTCERS